MTHLLTLMLVVANLTNANDAKNLKNDFWHMGTYLRVLHEGYQMSTNMTGINGFQKSLPPCA